MHSRIYLFEVIAAGILWGIISIFLKPLNSAGLSPMQILFVRGAFSSVIMLIFLCMKNRDLLKFRLKDIWMFFGTGVISLTFFSLCYFRTIIEAGASIAVILLYTSPIFVLFFSYIFFHEKFTRLKVIALIMTFTGCILVSGLMTGSGEITPAGFIIGLGAGLGYALYSVFSRLALRKYHPLTITFYTFLLSACSIAPFCNLPYVCSVINLNLLPVILGISLLCAVLPYIFYTHGMTGLETGKAAIFVTVEPLVGTLTGICLWGEPVSVCKILGIALIFAAVIMLGLKRS
ncbi:MAG: EamA family transporter [Spirochaetia bacterium]|nr:EamA family transporter [Spirochaetia bacterium]